MAETDHKSESFEVGATLSQAREARGGRRAHAAREARGARGAREAHDVIGWK